MATKDLTMLQLDPYCPNHWAILKEDWDTLTKSRQEKLRKEKGVLFVVPRELWSTLVDAVNTSFLSDSDYANYFFVQNPDLIKINCTDMQSYVWTGTHYTADADNRLLQAALRALARNWNQLLLLLKTQLLENERAGRISLEDLKKSYGGMAIRDVAEKVLPYFDGAKIRMTVTAIMDAKSATATDSDLRDLIDNPETAGHMLTFSNGYTYDLETRTAHPATPADNIACVAPAAYNPQAHSQAMIDFIDAICNRKPDTKRYLLQLLGNALDGSCCAKDMPFLIGPHDNGKTSLMRVLTGTFGLHENRDRGYCGTINPQNLSEKALSGGQCTPELDNIIGARIIGVNEGSRKSMPDCATLKRASGGDFITSNPKYKGAHSAPMIGTFFWNSNEMIFLDDPTMYTSNRVHIVLLDHIFTSKDRDLNIVRRLLADEDAKSTLVNLIIAGYNDFCDSGMQFAIPEESKKLLEKYHCMADPISAFLDANCIHTENPKDRIFIVDMFPRYNHWLAKLGYDSVKRKDFVISLSEKAYIDSYGNSACITGYQLKAEDAD